MIDHTRGAGIAAADRPAHAASLLRRLLTLRIGAMLIRNTVVSCMVFAVGLALLWLLVTRGGVDEVIAAAIGFVVGNTLHYLLGRSWIFRGTERGLHSGYILFLGNSAIGLAITVLLYAAVLEWTQMNYLLARTAVSVIAGLVVFVLNAVFNFRQV